MTEKRLNIDLIEDLFVREELIRLYEENEQLKQKILDEIDLEIAYVNEVYSDGRMSIEQYDGAIICLQELRGKFE
jgi:hypothetical protein